MYFPTKGTRVGTGCTLIPDGRETQDLFLTQIVGPVLLKQIKSLHPYTIHI